MSIAYFITLCFTIICLIGVIILTILTARNHLKVKQELLRRNAELSNQRKMLDNSNDMLEFVRTVVGSLVVLRWRVFEDSRDLTKVTQANIEELANAVAKEAHSSINFDNIHVDDVYFSEQFYHNYLIETAFILIKEVLDRAVEKKLEEEEY